MCLTMGIAIDSNVQIRLRQTRTKTKTNDHLPRVRMTKMRKTQKACNEQLHETIADMRQTQHEFTRRRKLKYMNVSLPCS